MFSHRELCFERAAATVGSAQPPEEEEADPADVVLPNKATEKCCFIPGASPPAQVCFLPLKHFQGNLSEEQFMQR